PEELVTEAQRARRAVAPLAEIVKGEPQRLTEAEQPLEVRRLEPELPAVHGAGRRYQCRVHFVARPVAVGPALSAGVVNHPELVHQDFLRLAGGLKGVGIDGAVERGEQELVGEYRELDGEVSNLVERHLA